MCDCNSEINVVLINIYLTMAEYKVNSKAVKGVRLAGKKSVDFRKELSQADLAYAYEELNITDWIDKTDKSNEKNTSKKLKVKSSEASKKDSEKE
tara:strand:- start:12170 stop:12454 length:285 start_codon:yes stop_codon:yes gene_type:complete